MQNQIHFYVYFSHLLKPEIFIIIVCIYLLRIGLTLRELLKIPILASVKKLVSCFEKVGSLWLLEWWLAIFLSVLDNGDVIYRNAVPSPLKPLETVYHSALRFITVDSYGAHHCILCDEVGWSSLAERRYLFIYEALVGGLPPYISMMLDWKFGPYLTSMVQMVYA